jgi:glycosyltransferase involved in cell wall biosynthesis
MQCLMTIVWINKRVWKHPGPIVNMSLRNAHSFANLGLSSHLFVGQGGQDEEAGEDLRNFYGLEPLPNFTVHRIPRRPVLLGNASASISRAGVAFVEKQARQEPVALFTREASLLPQMAWISRNRRIRTFYELHDFYADLSWRPHRPRLRELREKWLERLFLPCISGLVCITRGMEKRYQGLFPGHATIALPLGTEPRPPTDIEARRRARTLFYVGHMHGAKGVSFMEQAAVELAGHGVRTEFWGGYEKDALRIRRSAEQKGLQSMIHAVSFRPPSELNAALAARGSLGVVMLADTYYNRHLTCPVKALDYLSHGIPALGTDIPSVREVLDDSGHYVAEGDTTGFVRAALGLLDDPGAYAEAVSRARQRAARITWQERAGALVRFAGACG